MADCPRQRQTSLTRRAVRAFGKLLGYTIVVVFCLEIVGLLVAMSHARHRYSAAQFYTEQSVCTDSVAEKKLAGTPYGICGSAREAVGKEYWMATGLFEWAEWHSRLAQNKLSEIVEYIMGKTQLLLIIGAVYVWLFRDSGSAGGGSPPDVHVHVPRRRRNRISDKSAFSPLDPGAVHWAHAALPSAWPPLHLNPPPAPLKRMPHMPPMDVE